MNKEYLEEMAFRLGNRIDNINRWIEANPETDPNLYEMTECLMEFGNITSLYRNAMRAAESENGNTINNYDVIKEETLQSLSEKVRRMMKLRGLVPLDKDEKAEGFKLVDAEHGFSRVESPFFDQNGDVTKFLNDIYYLSITGSYQGADVLGNEEFEEKKRVFARIAGVYLYTWQESQKDLNFTYGNEAEYAEMSNGFAHIKEVLDEVGVYYFEGGNSLDNMFEAIKGYCNFDVKEEESAISK